MKHDPTPHDAPALHCLGGQGAPPDLVADARQILAFPKAAQRAFWTLLVATLADEVPAQTRAQIDAFAEQHVLRAPCLHAPIRAHRFLLREAADHKLSKETYARDLVTLAGSELQGRRLFEIIMPGYELGCASLSRARVGKALASHGSLLDRVDWRLDEIVVSREGNVDRARVGFLTLGYRTGPQVERLTLQLLPAELQQLEAACRAMLGKSGEVER